MEKSALFTVNFRDFLRGAIVAVLAAVIASVNTLITDNTLFSTESLTIIGMAALSGFVGYLATNFATNSTGKILTPEQK